MTLLSIPGPLDPHVHLRDQEWAHKGTFDSETAAALAGGYWAVIDMPNTPPPTTDGPRLDDKRARVARSARCDVALFLGAAPGSWPTGFDGRAATAAGLKLYLDATTGDLLLQSDAERGRLVRAWLLASAAPIAVHAEGDTLEQVLDLVRLLRVRVHVCHLSSRDEVGLVRDAKAEGLPVSAGVTPHHLYLTHDDASRLGTMARVKPELKTAGDRDALWEALRDGTIDLVESDHAPHTREEKASADPPHGVPGLETTLPLLGLAVHEGRLTPERVVELVATAPQRLFGLDPPPGTTSTLDLEASWVIEDAGLRTAVGWSPFDGMRVRGRVSEVRIGGRPVFDGQRVLAEPGSGSVLRPRSVLPPR